MASPTRTRPGYWGELIRYLEHRKSGALEFDDMGEAWVGVRDQVGSLRTWSAAPPKLRPEHAEPPQVDEAIPVALTSTDYSSQDGSEPSDAGNEAPDRLSSLESTPDS